MLSPRALEQDNMSLFFFFYFFLLFHCFNEFGGSQPITRIVCLFDSGYVCFRLTIFLLIAFQPLSFESKKSYTLKVEGANPHLEMRFLNLGPFQDTTTVHISVEDVDEPPVFEPGFYFVEVPEDVTIGTTIQIISAKDPDVSNNSIRFSHRFHFVFISWNFSLPFMQSSGIFSLLFSSLNSSSGNSFLRFLLLFK